MEKKTKQKIKNFTIEVIDFFLGIPESLVDAFDRKEFYRMMSGFSNERELTCANIAGLISGLKRRGYIEVRKTANSESIRFTNKAKLLIIDRIAIKKPTDKTHVFVSFDIPEQLRANRDGFRRTIKRMGFRQIQKSLWVCNRNIGEYVELAAKEYKVWLYIVYIVSDLTNIEKTIQSKLKNKENRKSKRVKTE